MSTTVKAALLQTDWAGDQETMIDKHEEAAREAAAQGAQVMCFQELFYGPVLLPGAGRRVLQLHRADPRRADDEALPERREGARHGDRAADVRDRAAGPVPQHRRGHRCRRHVPRQVPQAAHPAGAGLLGEVLLRARHGRIPGLRDRGRQGRRLHLLRPPLPRGLAHPRARTAPRSCSTRAPRTAASASTCGASSSRPRPSRTCTTWARSTASASSRSARTTSTGRATSSTRRGSSWATWATRTSPS